MQKEIPTEATQVETEPTTPEPTVLEGDDEMGDDTTKTDPLDTIDDIDSLRAEAKKYRGIASRKDKKEVTTTSEKPKTDSQYVTRDELYAENRNKVIQSIENFTDDDPQADFKRELNDNWDDVMGYYVARNGQKSPEDIMKDIRAAYVVWKDQTGGAPDDSARQLQGTTVGNATGGSQKPTKSSTDTDDDPRFSKPKSPDKWYTKKD